MVDKTKQYNFLWKNVKLTREIIINILDIFMVGLFLGSKRKEKRKDLLKVSDFQVSNENFREQRY